MAAIAVLAKQGISIDRYIAGRTGVAKHLSGIRKER
jgi:hypothetical protein